jgi:hypothetical protein
MHVSSNGGSHAHRRSGWIAAAALFAAVGCSMDTSPIATRRSSSTQSGANGARAAGAGAFGAAGSGFSNPGEPNAAGGASGGASAPLPGAPGGGTCAQGTANATPITPTVWLVVDGSSSMNDDFEAGRTRWQALRATLMDPGGVVASLEALANIGMVIYSGGGIDLLGGECVNLVTVEPALNNHAALDAAYPQDPIGTGTPTDKALDHVVTNLPVTNQQTLDMPPSPIYVVLATDGAPNDSCQGLFGGDDSAVEQRVVDVAARGTQMGMDMLIISLAGGDAQLQTHLQQVSQATRTQTPPFVPATQAELIGTFLEIVGGATCQVALNGTVTAGQQCRGEVLLNGAALSCDSDDGWRLMDPRTVQLTGTACESFRATASQVHASFPCEAFSPD